MNLPAEDEDTLPMYLQGVFVPSNLIKTVQSDRVR